MLGGRRQKKAPGGRAFGCCASPDWGKAGFPVGLSPHSLQCHFPEGKSQLLELEIFTALGVPAGEWSIYKYIESQRSKIKFNKNYEMTDQA